MRWSIPLVVALALLVAVSCDQQPVGPSTDQVSEAPAFNFMNGPEQAGAVFREGQLFHYRFWVLDSRTQLWAEVSNDPAGGACVSAPGEVPIDVQYAGDWNINVQSEEWYARVWDARGRTGEAFCDWIAGHDPIAVGMVDFKQEIVGNKEDFKGNGQIARTDGLGKTHALVKFSWEWDKQTGQFVGFRSARAHLGPDPRD